MHPATQHLLTTSVALTLAAGLNLAANATDLRLAELAGGTNRLEEIPATAPAVVQHSNFELMNELEKLRQEVRRLRGELEQQAHQLEQAQKRQQKTLSEFDKRLRVTEGGSPKDAGNTLAVPVAADDDQTTPAGEPTAVTSVPSATPSHTPTPTVATVNPSKAAAPEPTQGPTVAGTAASHAPGLEQEAYDQSFNLLKLGRYDESISGFKGFLKDYPSSKYTDSALYWLGETYYVKNQYELAIAEYSRLVKDHPTSQRLTQALLKIGYSYHELGRTEQAIETLEGLRQRHPSSTAARLAEERLRRIKLEQQ
jgi:tol-pal system protein YbgF